MHLEGRFEPGIRGEPVDEKDGKLHFVESVKNGFVPATRLQTFKALERLHTDTMPFANLPEKKGAHAMDKEKMEQVHWLKPRMVAEIAFNERTARGHLRHSKFVRLRMDKSAKGGKAAESRS